MQDLISRQAAIDAINQICPIDTEYDCTLLDRVDVRCVLTDLPSAQPSLNQGQSRFNQDQSSDLISRSKAIRWVKAECNPYGKPTLEFESGKKVIEHLKQMPSAQPEQRWIP